jgi:hypothetical protein
MVLQQLAGTMLLVSLLATAAPASSWLSTAPGPRLLPSGNSACRICRALLVPASTCSTTPATSATCCYVLQEEKALKALKEKAKTGSVGGAGLKKSGKK